MYFIEEDVRANLLFGTGEGSVSDAQWKRALRICEKLAFPDRLMEFVRSKENTIECMANNAAVLSPELFIS